MVKSATPAVGLDLLLAAPDQRGWRGLINNPRCFGIALFSSIGGVLYGYNQGVFSNVQVQAEFHHRFQSTVSTLHVPLEWINVLIFS